MPLGSKKTASVKPSETNARHQIALEKIVDNDGNVASQPLTKPSGDQEDYYEAIHKSENEELADIDSVTLVRYKSSGNVIIETIEASVEETRKSKLVVGFYLTETIPAVAGSYFIKACRGSICMEFGPDVDACKIEIQ